MQSNYLTGQEYKGQNALVLAMSGFQSTEWLTFLQVKEVGGTVIKGSKGTQIIKVIEDKDTDKIGIKTYTVFNTEQCENLDADLKLTPEQYEIYKVLKKETELTRKAIAKTSKLLDA
jgi:antirestriction protein ArdC